MKATSVGATYVMVLAVIAAVAAAETAEDCWSRCSAEGLLPRNPGFIASCIRQCPKRGSPPANFISTDGAFSSSNSQADYDSNFYCNYGCSLHRCAKFTEDENRADACADECSKIYCKNV